MAKIYQCGCGEWMGEGCDWQGPAKEMLVVMYTPEAARETALAAGRSDAGAVFIAVCRECWEYIQEQEAFDSQWWNVRKLDPRAFAETVED